MALSPPLGGVETADGLRLFGTFATLHDLDLPNTAASDLYEGFYAGFYDAFTREEQWDIPRYLDAARAAGGPVLELACGSGRIALPLARAGIEVDALDLSEDMLGVLRRRFEREPADIRRRVRPRVGDVTRLDLVRRYPLALLGATSICLLHRPEQRVEMFAGVRRHLAEDGRFLFDFAVTSPEVLRAQDSELLTIGGATGDLKRFTLLGRRWLPEDGLQLVNFYSEVVDGAGATRRFLGSTAKAVLDRDTLVDELEQGGLELVRDDLTLPARDEASEEIRLIECRPGLATFG
jgi:SAM-dependent methyltransferase